MTASVALYDLASARDILDDWFLEHEGEVTPELEQMLADLEGQIDEKVERVGLYIREQLATAKAIEEEEKRLGDRRKAKERRAESLKQYLQEQLERLGKSRVEGKLLTVALQKNSTPSIICVAPIDVFAEPQGDLFVEVFQPATEYRLRRDAVIAAWKAKQPLPAGVEVTLGQHLRIR